MNTVYQPVDNGYRIINGRRRYNRVLYGGHAHDDRTERFVTFAGDQPIIMGAVTDWRQDAASKLAKCGTLMIGVALAPGLRVPRWGDNGDQVSRWFHDGEGTVATFRNGWMEYEIQPFFQTFPHVNAVLEVFPLIPEDGFLVHLRVDTDQRVVLGIGFGGVTPLLGRLDLSYVSDREFKADHCRDNRITLGTNRAKVALSAGKDVPSTMWLGATFPVEVSIGNALLVAEGPGRFLTPENEPGQSPMARMRCIIDAGKTLDGYLVVVRNEEEPVLDRWLATPAPEREIKQAIHLKQAALELHTPDPLLDLALPPTVIALDATWHKNTFCHGAYAWHTPYLGWRGWYGPTVLGWHERVATAFRAHAATQVRQAQGPEEVAYLGRGFEWDQNREYSQYHVLKNSTGWLPSTLAGDVALYGYYDMQEVGVDMFLHHLEWTGDLDLAKEMFDTVTGILDWEERILDPDGDGLYQNFLNTWISDAHWYNGGGCAQASAYNYRANRVMGQIARKLGRDPGPFAKRAQRIMRAMQEKLWLPEKGVMAEYIDTLGHKLVHPSPELATIYHSIECDVVDPFQAWQMLRFTETDLRNEYTAPRRGRAVWSSNWYPQMHSSCGLYSAEVIHLAWAYFKCGLAEQGWEILKAIVDAHFMGDNPGMACQCLTVSGDGGAQDFTDILSMHTRTVVEGLFGIRFCLLDDRIEMAPNLPSDWTHASLRVRDIGVGYERDGQIETLTVACSHPGIKRLSLPLRGVTLDAVHLNGAPAAYSIEPGMNRSDLVVESEAQGVLALRVAHGCEPRPVLQASPAVLLHNRARLSVSRGEILGYKAPSGGLANIRQQGGSLYADAVKTGNHTVFVRVRHGEWDGWLTADISVVEEKAAPLAPARGVFHPVDITAQYNIALADIHRQEYWSPRPKGFSIGLKLNGRSGWDRPQARDLAVNDQSLRQSGGTYVTKSGIPFLTPATGPNAACVSLWDNFPKVLRWPLAGRGTELAVLFVGVTTPMQSRVENARFTVRYAGGGREQISLINPVNFDDWLYAAYQEENEVVPFSDGNHALVQRLRLNPEKELRAVEAEAIANEIIVGVLGLSVRRP